MSNQVTVYRCALAAKANKTGQHPIYFRITIQSKSTVFSNRKFLIPSKWDAKTRNMGRTKYHDVLYEE